MKEQQKTYEEKPKSNDMSSALPLLVYKRFFFYYMIVLNINRS